MLVLLAAVPVLAANICDPTTGTQCQKVNSAGAAEIIRGKGTRATYQASLGALAGATAHSLAIDAESGRGFRLVKWCIGVSNATAASSINVVLQRRTTATTAGTVATAEGTGTDVVSKFDPNDSNWTGRVTRDGTLGTAGAVVDQQQFQIGIIATGAGSIVPYCYEYGTEGDKVPIVTSGTGNVLAISVPSMGAGSLAISISATFVAE